MHRLPSHTPPRRWRRTLGALSILVLAALVLAGCHSDTKQKWLSVFFDGVPQPGATNKVSFAGARISTTNAVGQVTTTTNALPPRPKLNVHPPYADHNCTACHESEFSQKMIGKPGAVCFGCHTELQKTFVAGKVKHQPVAEGDCVSCHNPHQSINRKLLVKTGPALCLTCHDDPLAAGKVRHQAVESGDCLDCHAPHSTNFKGLLKKSAKDTCADCHDDLTAKKKVVHQPVGDGDCLECHTPHAGKIKGLLKNPSRRRASIATTI